MSLDYRKGHDNHSSDDSFWTSYSDLFLGLSCIFLLLYVVSSMRQGADVIEQQIINEHLTTEVNDLKNQLKAYETIKDQYMKEKASEDEKQEYNALIDKLSLLKEESESENDKLKKALLENKQKIESLNKYQQMVRNVLNANKLAKTKLSTREEVIDEKSQVITEKEAQVKGLETEVNQNKHLIAEREKEINMAKSALVERKKLLIKAFRENKITRDIYEKRMAKANIENNEKIKALAEEKRKYQEDLGEVSKKLQSVAMDLNQTKGLLDQKTGENELLQDKLTESKETAANKIAELKGNFAKEQARERAEFEKELGNVKIGAAEREKREKAFREAASQKERAMNEQMAGLQGQLQKAKAEIEARKTVAKNISNSFAAAGIKAEVDADTGEVTLDFGQSYFDSGSAQLKEEMKAVIEKAVPVYAKSLLGNDKISEKVSSVEIIGYASPTYKGRYVDPKSSDKQDQEALKYNMDLSYSRAKSIFNYILDNQGNNSTYNKNLMSLMKVSGRSFLESSKIKSDVSPENFCKVNDCKKAQKVVIRFNMDTKK